MEGLFICNINFSLEALYSVFLWFKVHLGLELGMVVMGELGSRGWVYLHKHLNSDILIINEQLFGF